MHVALQMPFFLPAGLFFTMTASNNDGNSSRRWLFLRPRVTPATRIHQLHQELLSLVVESDDEALAKRFAPRRPSWRESLERLALHGSIQDDPPVKPRPLSPRKQRIEAAAVSFSDNHIQSAMSDDTADSNDEIVHAVPPPMCWPDLENCVSGIIQEIGRLLVESQPHRSSAGLRSDPVFEYFCEMALLDLLIDMAGDKLSRRSSQTFHRVVWSPTVKSQVLETVSLLLSSLRDVSSLYYLLSQNSMNELVACMLPLQQWTSHAIATILPTYVDLLKQLTLQLTASPHLFPCFLDPNHQFPLFSALLEAAIFSYGQSNAFLHATCLNQIVSLLRLSPVHQWIPQLCSTQTSAAREDDVLVDDEKKEESALCLAPATSTTAQESVSPSVPGPPPQVRFAQHLTTLFVDRFERLVTLTEGPVVNTARSYAIAEQLSNWNHQIDLLNDVFACQVPLWNVRICEALLQGLVSQLLLALTGDEDTCMLRRSGADVGVMDADVIPGPEARAQVATLCFDRLFGHVRYPPFLRMLSVALFHPFSTNLWKSFGKLSGSDLTLPATTTAGPCAPYRITRALNDVVSGCCHSGTTSVDESLLPQNDYRRELLRALQGGYGEYRFIPTAMLFETLKGLDRETLEVLSILRPMEEALSTFLSRKHQFNSAVSRVALQSAAFLSVQVCCQLRASFPDGQDPMIRMDLASCRNFFYGKVLESQQAPGVSEVMVQLVDRAVRALYKRTTLPVHGETGPCVFAFLLSRYSCHSCASHEALVRKIRGATQNAVEEARFYAEMSIFYRACCNLLDRHFSGSKVHQTLDTEKRPAFDPLDMAGELAQIFNTVREKPGLGTDLDLRGRAVFPCSPATVACNRTTSPMRSRTWSEDMVSGSSAKLALVLDPGEIFVVRAKSVGQVKYARGIVICGISLLDMIAAASDEEWLHVAVRRPDVGRLIKNGNMALRFESAGTSAIVRQSLDRCRQVLHAELNANIQSLFQAPTLKTTPTQASEENESLQTPLRSRESSTTDDNLLPILKQAQSDQSDLSQGVNC